LVQGGTFQFVKRATVKNGTNGANGSVVVLTRAELQQRADQASKELVGVTRAQAFKMLDNGKLRGTLAEAVLTPMRDLLK
jgi:hypothetical protein